MIVVVDCTVVFIYEDKTWVHDSEDFFMVILILTKFYLSSHFHFSLSLLLFLSSLSANLSEMQ